MITAQNIASPQPATVLAAVESRFQAEPSPVKRAQKAEREDLRTIRDIQGTQEALRDSEVRFRAMAETVPSIIYTFGPDGRCEYVNHRFYELTGVPPGTAAGFGWLRSMHPQDAGQVELRWAASIGTMKEWTQMFRLRRRDGQFRWFLSKATPILQRNGQAARSEEHT